jgi:hypothetical protein
MMKAVPPLRVSAQWIDYAHGPGAEDGQELATRLVDLAADADPVLIRDAALIREVISVAELYTSHSTVQDDDRVWFRAYPGNVIKRGKLWLALHTHTQGQKA